MLSDDPADWPEELDLDEIHLRNFKCRSTFDTRLRSLFQSFYNAMFNDLLFKINSKTII